MCALISMHQNVCRVIKLFAFIVAIDGESLLLLLFTGKYYTHDHHNLHVKITTHIWYNRSSIVVDFSINPDIINRNNVKYTYVPFASILIGNYCSRKRLGRFLAMSNQKKMRIEKSISDTENSEKPQLLAHMPEVISTYRRCVYCSTKEKEKRTNVICTFCGVCICVKNCFLLYHQNYVYQQWNE